MEIEQKEKKPMKVRFRGIYTLDEFFQAVYEQRRTFEDHGIEYIRSASLYYTPVDAYGDSVQPQYSTGEPVEGWNSDGPYRTAAQDYGL